MRVDDRVSSVQRYLYYFSWRIPLEYVLFYQIISWKFSKHSRRPWVIWQFRRELFNFGHSRVRNTIYYMDANGLVGKYSTILLRKRGRNPSGSKFICIFRYPSRPILNTGWNTGCSVRYASVFKGCIMKTTRLAEIRFVLFHSVDNLVCYVKFKRLYR